THSVTSFPSSSVVMIPSSCSTVRVLWLILCAPIPDLPDRKTICIMERGNEKCQPKNENTQRRRVTMRPSRRGRMVTEQGRPSREVAAELGICIDTLRSWLKAAGAPSPGQADRQNRDARRLRELEAEIRALRKKLEEKDGVIDILKKSVGILSKP
ncbi:MAG: transposase, partial [Oscillospiraceae bacterium]|nr:transposase [Oscillospiraceae bacterium]